MARDSTFQVVGTNPDGTFVVRQVSGDTQLAPVAAGGIAPQSGANAGGFQARVNGRIVTFASEADYREAEMAWRDMQGGGSMPEIGGQNAGMMGTGNAMGGRGRGGSSGTSFLRTGSDAAEAVTGFFAGRNLRQKRDDLINALDAEAAARDKIAQLTSNSSLSPLIGPLLDWIDAERQVTAGALSILDDQIFAMDMQAGIGVVRTMSDLWDGYRRGGGMGQAQSDAGFSALAVGAIGLGVGFILSNSSTSSRNGRRTKV